MTNKMMIAIALMFCGLCLAQQPTTETVTTTMEIIHGSQRETVALMLPGPVPAAPQETAKPADPPPISCACPVAKPIAPRKKVAVVPPSKTASKVQMAGIGVVPPMPEWILWLAACLFGVMLLAIAFILGRVTAPQLAPAGAPVVINIPPQQPPPAPAAPAVAPAVPAP